MFHKEAIDVLERPDNYLSDDYMGDDVLDIVSGANHGLTLRQARANYQKTGACTKEMLRHVREPYEEERVGGN